MFVEGNQRRTALLLGVGVEGGLVVLACLLGWLLNRPLLDDVRGGLSDVGWGIVASAPMLVLFFIFVRWPVGPLKRIKAISEEVIRPLFRSCTLFDLAFISLLAGLGEELLFRGVLQGLLSDWLGGIFGLALASLLFGLVHLLTPTYFVIATLMGAYLGWLWRETGTLAAPIVAHALYDFVALVYLVRGGREDIACPNERGPF